MSQYGTTTGGGTVDVTNGSSIVTVVGADDDTGNLFAANDILVINAVAYVITGTPETDEIAISGTYGGTTDTGLSYVVHRDFLVSGIPIMNTNDAELPAIFNRAMEILVAGGGGGVSTYQALLDTPSFTGAAGLIPSVNAGETGHENIDHRFALDVIAEVSPASLSNRLVHYSALLGTLSASGVLVSQLDDISGNARHATPDNLAPRLVGSSGSPSYGLDFGSSAASGDDVTMLATVPANTNTMFFFVIGRMGRQHTASRNMLKLAHDGTVDTQTAGDIEIAAASSGSGVNLKLSTSGGLGQNVALGDLKNGAPFVLGLSVDTGVVTGWVATPGAAPVAISDTYTHGSGFDADRIRLGQTVDVVTDIVLHEVLVASTLPADAVIKQLLLWGMNRYFRSQLVQDNALPRFSSSPDVGGYALRNWRPPILTTASNGASLVDEFGRTFTVSSAATAQARWSGYLFRHIGSATFDFTLLATVSPGWQMDFEQEFGTTGQIDLAFASGATNLDTFPETVPAGISLKIRCVRNTDGSSAEYVGYQSTQLVGGAGHVVQYDGTPLAARAALNFADGLIATDDSGNGATKVVSTAAVQFAGAGADGVVPDPESESGRYLADDGNWYPAVSVLYETVDVDESSTLTKAAHSHMYLDANNVLRIRTLVVQHSTTPATAVTVTLPSAAAGDGAAYVFDVPAAQTGLVTIQRAGSDLIDGLNAIAMGLSNSPSAVLTNSAPTVWRYEGDSQRRGVLPPYDEKENSVTPASGTATLDFGAVATAVGNHFKSSISAAVTTVTFTNGTPSSGFIRPFTWRISADGTNRSVTVPGGWVRLGGWANPFTVQASGHAIVAGHVESDGTVFASLALTT